MGIKTIALLMCALLAVLISGFIVKSQREIKIERAKTERTEKYNNCIIDLISNGYNYRGEFDKNLSYTRGDIVEEKGSIYVCLLDYSPENSDEAYISPFFSNHEWVSVPVYSDLDSIYTAIAEAQSLADEYVESSASKNTETNIAVLMYHYFNNEDDLKNDPYKGITTEEIEADLKWFNEQGIQTVTGRDVLDYINGEIDLPEKCVWITIDDGHYSIYRDFFPLAQKYNCKATVSLVGEYISDYSSTRVESIPKSMWMNWDEVSEIAECGLIEFGSHSNYMHHNETRYGVKMLEGESASDYSNILIEDEEPLIDLITKATGEKPIIFAYPYSAPQGGYYSFMTDQFGFQFLLNGDEEEWSSTKGNKFIKGQGLDSLNNRMIRRFGRYTGDNIEKLVNDIWNDN